MNPPPVNTPARLETKLDALSCDMAEIKLSLKNLAEGYQKFQIDYERRHAALENQAGAAHTRLDGQSARLDALEKDIKGMRDAIIPFLEQGKMIGRGAKIVVGSFVTLIIALLWGIFTHTISIGIPAIP